MFFRRKSVAEELSSLPPEKSYRKLLSKLRAPPSREMLKSYREAVETRYKGELADCMQKVRAAGFGEGAAYVYCIFRVMTDHLEDEKSLVGLLRGQAMVYAHQGVGNLRRLQRDQKLLNSLIKEIEKRLSR